MAEIILARHGETEWNVVEIFRGRIDIGLNGTGLKQTELLAEYLSKLKIGAVYSSPLGRALKTAEAVARLQNGLEVNITPGLNDCDFGEWQGLSVQQVKDKYGELYTRWVDHPELVKIPGGESLDDVRKRALTVVHDAVARYKTAVLVSHRVVNKVLICALLGVDNSLFWNIKQDTCGITTFAHANGRFVLTGHNDTSFLKPVQGKAPPPDF